MSKPSLSVLGHSATRFARGGVPLAVALALPSCAGSERTDRSDQASRSSAADGGTSAKIAATVTPGSPRGAGKLLTLPEARRYMAELINRDRAKLGVPPIELEDGSASRAAQLHSEDMATHGFLGHWGTDGSVPEQRHTDAGGVHMVLENASCFVDEKTRVLDKSPLIDAKYIERAEEMFFNEEPPHDGHRKNILRPYHKKVGIGIAQPVATANEIPVPCFTQEFIDAYGSYQKVPRSVKVGETLHVEGVLPGPAAVAGVGLARVDLPQSLSVGEANRRRSYPVPTPYQMYWPAGFKTPIPLKVKDGWFSVDVPVSDQGKAGLYEVSIWARLPQSPDLVIVGLRTVRVDGG